MKVLTIGNSFANNATVYIKDLVEASAKKGEFIIGKTNLGGCSLEKHWNLPVIPTRLRLGLSRGLLFPC